MVSLIAIALIALSGIANAENSQNAIQQSSDDASLTRIVNGRDSVRQQFPHQALIFVTDFENRTTICGGSILTKNYILTSYNCVMRYRRMDVHVGALNTFNFTENGRAIRSGLGITRHRHHVERFHINDIALIPLNASLVFSDVIQPVKIPVRGESYHNIPVITSGFGQKFATNGTVADVLQWAPMNTINNFRCAQEFRNPLLLRPSIICAIGDNRQSTCVGDAGGPLITRDGVLIGITSFWRNEGCWAGGPSAFTRFTEYLDWIERDVGLDLNAQD